MIDGYGDGNAAELWRTSANSHERESASNILNTI
jgi:hypothetical protein